MEPWKRVVLACSSYHLHHSFGCPYHDSVIRCKFKSCGEVHSCYGMEHSRATCRCNRQLSNQRSNECFCTPFVIVHCPHGDGLPKFSTSVLGYTFWYRTIMEKRGGELDLDPRTYLFQLSPPQTKIGQVAERNKGGELAQGG